MTDWSVIIFSPNNSSLFNIRGIFTRICSSRVVFVIPKARMVTPGGVFLKKFLRSGMQSIV